MSWIGGWKPVWKQVSGQLHRASGSIKSVELKHASNSCTYSVTTKHAASFSLWPESQWGSNLYTPPCNYPSSISPSHSPSLLDCHYLSSCSVPSVSSPRRPTSYSAYSAPVWLNTPSPPSPVSPWISTSPLSSSPFRSRAHSYTQSASYSQASAQATTDNTTIMSQSQIEEPAPFKSALQAELHNKNEEYAKTFPNRNLPTAPSKQYAIVTCMDSRIDNFAAFGVTLGDAHIIRNAGGNARDAFRSLVISQHMLKTKEIMIIKHTGCGMQMAVDTHPTTKVLANVVAVDGAKAAAQAAAELEHIDWGSWPDVVDSVKSDVQWLRSQASLSGIVSGWVYDVHTGKVTRVDI